MVTSTFRFSVIFRLFLFFIIYCSLFTANAQQPIYSAGKDFWLAFMDNDDMDEPIIILKVFITSEYNTSGSISIPLQGWTQNFSVSANQRIIIEVPTDFAYSDSSEIIEKKGIHIIADNNITVWAINNEDYTTDGTNVIPTLAIGDKPEYLVASYPGISGYSNYLASEFVIVGTEDASKFTITPTANTIGGKIAKIPFSITLNKGETYQVMAQDSGDLTGTSVKTIKGSCNLFSGVACAYAPVDCSSCDHLYKQCYPVQFWGEEYILTPFMYQFGGYVFRVIASENNTSVSINGHTPMILNAGKYYSQDVTDAIAMYVYADKPITVVQYMKGAQCNGFNDNGFNNNNSDPSMLILNSNNQLLKDLAIFESATTNIVDSLEFVNVITKTVNSGNIELDGININKSNFTQVPSLNTWSYATLQIDTGMHTISSNGLFIAYAYGVGEAESYLYSVGMGTPCQVAQFTIQPVSPPVQCKIGFASFIIGATGDNNISYQWQVHNGIWTNLCNGGTSPAYSGINSDTLNVSNETTTLQYRCIAINCSNIITPSNTAILAIAAPVSINPAFHNQSQCLDSSIAFSLNPTAGIGPFSYQWMLNGNIIADASNSLFTKVSISRADSGKYSCIITNACNSVTGDVVSLTPVQCVRFRHKISGYATYDNKALTPLSSKFDSTITNIYLYNSGDTLISEAQTDDFGYYEFLNIINGNYYITGSSKKAWGGCNPTDALIVNRNYIGLYDFKDSLLYHAGDVDSSGTLNPTDALIINRRYIGLMNKYSNVSNWTFQKIKVEMAGENLTHDIKAVCTGDVNASYAPYLIPQKIIYTPINTLGSINISPNPGPFEIPVYLDDNIELGAIGIKFQISDSRFQILGVKSDINGLIYNMLTNQGTEHGAQSTDINIAWSATNEGIKITPNKPLFYITAIYNGISNLSSFQTPASSFRLSPESELADIDVNLISTDKLFIPQLNFSILNSQFSIKIYPNPFTNTTNFTYTLPEDLNVNLSVYNVLGEKVTNLVNSNQQAGQYTIKYNASDLRKGIYYCKIEATNPTSAFTKTNIMVIVR